MKKAEFLKQENVPQFIKDLVAKAPDDTEITMHSIEVGKPEPTAKEDGCKKGCEHCEGSSVPYEDGINIGPYIEIMYRHLTEIADLADCNGRIRVTDADIAISVLDSLEACKDTMADYLRTQKKEHESNKKLAFPV